jgi:hypothetical protein
MGGQRSFDETLKSRRDILQSAAAVTAAAVNASSAVPGSSVAPGFDVEGVNADDSSDWIWLGNRSLRVGLLESSGGAIGWLGTPASARNLINRFDRGRLVQQSWYGGKDGSDWNGRPWRWNPVQGGDWKGKSSRIIARRVSEASAYVRTQPLHWATGEVVADVFMEQSLRLTEDILEIRYGFEYSGVDSHPPQHQELPAVFVDSQLRNLVLAEGSPAWKGAVLQRSRPGWPNEYRDLVEPWAAWVDDSNWGLGCCVPRIRQLTCYRFGRAETDPDACSYFAPIDTLAVTPGFRFSWTVWLTIGTADEIRERFRARLQG